MIRAVLDESAPRKLARLLTREELVVSAFPNRWKGTLNGRLLDIIEEAGFVALVTCDKRVPFQQNLSGRRIGLVVLPTPELRLLSARLDIIAEAIATISAGDVVALSLDPIT